MDTNLVLLLVGALAKQQASPAPAATEDRWALIVSLAIALITAYNTWQNKKASDDRAKTAATVDEIKKDVNSTASKLAEEKKAADLVASEQTRQIATLSEKIIGQDKAAAVIAASPIPVGAGQFSQEQVEIIRHIVQASK